MKYLYLILITLFLVGCSSGPNESEIQTAIAQTQNASLIQASSTYTPSVSSATPIPSKTPSPTDTKAPTATQTETFTPEPSPTSTPDTRVISGRPEDYILTPKDLPDRYILLPGDSTPHLNTEILAARGTENGKAYLAATKRIGGWIVWYQLASSTAIAPEWIQSYIVMFETAEGAALCISPEWNDDLFDRIKNGELELIENHEVLGDQTIVTVEKERQPSGKYYVWYSIEFRYRNVWAEIMGQGMESDVPPEYLMDAAKVVLEKLKQAQLKEAGE